MNYPHARPVTAFRHTRLAACLGAALSLGSGAVVAAGTTATLGKNGQLLSASHAGLPAMPSAAPPRLLLGDWSAHALPAFARSRSAARSGGAIQAVANCNDAGAGSLRDAVTAATDGDTVDLSALTCSTITLSSGAIEIKAKNLIIQGPGRAELRVSGNHVSQVFTSKKYADNLTIYDLSIADGRAAVMGGCVYSGADLTLDGVSVTGCTVGDASTDNAWGGGVAAMGELALVNSTISGNTAIGKSVYGGGGLSLKYATASDGSIVDHNVASASSGSARGGGLFGANGVGAFNDSRVSDNQARSVGGTAYGGGMFAKGAADNHDVIAMALLSTISNNTAHSDEQWSYGGGIQAGESGVSSGAIDVLGSTISGNSVTSNCSDCWIQGGGANAFGKIIARFSVIRDNAALSASASSGKALGGGLATDFSSSLPEDGLIGLINSTVSGNRAIGGSSGGRGYGGGIAAWSSPFASYYATLSANQASSIGGGAHEAGSATTSGIVNSLFANNAAPLGADIGSGSSVPVTFLGDHNLVRLAGSNIVLPAGTLNVDPKLLPLANNGGLSATHALAACSPAIDAAAPFASPIDSDQRGDPFVRNYGAAPDIGAFELQPDPDRVFHDDFEASPCP